ncbi:MAG: hypothetical protein PHO65_02365 [Sulfurovum sp.]|nr:hypothetical protein [Sulfurovum sp.]
MKKFTAALLAVTLSFTTLLAHKGDNHNMGLVLSLPHPMKAILPNYAAYNFTQEQDAKMQVIANEMPIKMHAKFDEAEALEKEIRIAVMQDGKSREDLAQKLDRLQTLKREITNLHIDTLLKIRSIMDGKQHKMMMQYLQQLQLKKAQHKH